MQMVSASDYVQCRCAHVYVKRNWLLTFVISTSTDIAVEVHVKDSHLFETVQALVLYMMILKCFLWASFRWAILCAPSFAIPKLGHAILETIEKKHVIGVAEIKYVQEYRQIVDYFYRMAYVVVVIAHFLCYAVQFVLPSHF